MQPTLQSLCREQVEVRGSRTALAHPSQGSDKARQEAIDHSPHTGITQQQPGPPQEPSPNTHGLHAGKQERPVQSVIGFGKVEEGKSSGLVMSLQIGGQQLQEQDVFANVTTGEKGRLLRSNGLG
jgi:hypothetical protein